MNRTIQPATVRKSLTVPVTQAHAFEVFTASFNRWWPRSHTTGNGPLKEVVLEPRVGGRWYGIDDDGTRVDFEHRLLENMGPDAQRVRDQLDSGWPGILERFAELCRAA